MMVAEVYDVMVADNYCLCSKLSNGKKKDYHNDDHEELSSCLKVFGVITPRIHNIMIISICELKV